MIEELNITTDKDKRAFLKSLILEKLESKHAHDNSNKKLINNGIHHTLKEVKDILTREVSEILKIPQKNIDKKEGLAEYGMDSMGVMALSREINNIFLLKIDAQELFSFKSINDMSNFILEFLKTNDTARPFPEKILAHKPATVISTVVVSKNKKEEPLTLASFEKIKNREDTEIGLFNEYVENQNFKVYSRENSVGTTITLSEFDTPLINYTNFDYLGYATHPKIIKSVKSAIDTYGLASSASPLVGGRVVLHDQLEDELLSFFNVKDTQITLFPTGYNTVFGSISAYMNEGDHIVMDSYCHASIVDGAIFSKANLYYYMHNDVEDLEKILKRIDNGTNRILVCTEGVFSIDGDFGDIKGVVAVSKKYGAKTFVDEAHSLLVTGDQGKGVCFSQGVLEEVDFLTATFSKTFPGIGGCLLTKTKISKYIDVYARNRIFSTALPPTIVAGALATLKLARGKDGDKRRKKIVDNGVMLRSLYEGKLTYVNSKSWVVSILIGDETIAIEMAAYLKTKGVSVSPVGYPVVARGFAKIRHFLSSEHTKEQLKLTAKLVLEAAEKFGVHKKQN